MPIPAPSPRFVVSGLILGTALACSSSPAKDGGSDESAASGANSSSGGGGHSNISLDGGTSGGTGNAAGSTQDGGNVGAGGTMAAVCGNSQVESPETCDDGNEMDGDGCSSNCEPESGYACPVPGEACVELAVCGDGNLGVGEECDDNNAKSGDGCTDECFVETGWQCPTAGSRCVAAACGDGVIAGNEQCEDGRSELASGDGCSDTCRIEAGYFCAAQGSACKVAVCGNGVPEGDEPCDDGNADVGDGCTPLCEREPTCVLGACTSTCGDGMILPGDGEECDDGNLTDSDGCSSECKQEEGYECTLVAEDPPEELVIPIAYRDFVATDRDTNGGESHPDFNTFYGGGTENLVLDTLLDGKPQFAGICDDDGPTTNPPCPDGKQLTTEENFDEWFRDGGRAFRVDRNLTLTRNASGQYVFDSGAGFFPLAGEGWVGEGKETAPADANFAFTSELRYWFQLEGGEELTFSGDDDVWVFINNRLMIDLGGLHSEKSKSIELTDEVITSLGMEKDRIYEVVLFHAERRESGSNFRLTLNGFVKTKSVCVAECGDGIVAGDEVCDDGASGGDYGFCRADCSGLGERCGDATVQDSEQEICDDGTNLLSYDFGSSGGGCAPGCKTPARCGDGEVDAAFGEQCDDGNLQDGDGCESNCTYRTSCGDGNVDEEDGETCDDGDRDNGDGCSQFCTVEQEVVR